MSSTQEFFGDNPWAAITKPCYPEGRRLYLNDERFWVSMDDNHHLLFFIQDSGGDVVKPLENLAGLSVSITQQSNGDQRLVCALTTSELELEDKFATVAKDIAFHCSNYKGAQLFLKTQDRIRSWANFLKPSRSGLSRSEFVGFFGELYTLVEYLTPDLTAPDAVRAWIGPEGKKQDFSLNSWALEVKTTLAGDQQTISISSLDQLDRVTNKLFLLRLVASPATDGIGISLRQLYTQCRQLVEHDALIEGMFLQKASALYGKAGESQLDDQFKISKISVFDVTDEFPRLTRNSVHAAIQEARYEISIGALTSFEVASDVKEILNNE